MTPDSYLRDSLTIKSTSVHEKKWIEFHHVVWSLKYGGLSVSLHRDFINAFVCSRVLQYTTQSAEMRMWDRLGQRIFPLFAPLESRDRFPIPELMCIWFSVIHTCLRRFYSGRFSGQRSSSYIQNWIVWQHHPIISTARVITSVKMYNPSADRICATVAILDDATWLWGFTSSEVAALWALGKALYKYSNYYHYIIIIIIMWFRFHPKAN